MDNISPVISSLQAHAHCWYTISEHFAELVVLTSQLQSQEGCVSKVRHSWACFAGTPRDDCEVSHRSQIDEVSSSPSRSTIYLQTSDWANAVLNLESLEYQCQEASHVADYILSLNENLHEQQARCADVELPPQILNSSLHFRLSPGYDQDSVWISYKQYW